MRNSIESGTSPNSLYASMECSLFLSCWIPFQWYLFHGVRLEAFAVHFKLSTSVLFCPMSGLSTTVSPILYSCAFLASEWPTVLRWAFVTHGAAVESAMICCCGLAVLITKARKITVKYLQLVLSFSLVAASTIINSKRACCVFDCCDLVSSWACHLGTTEKRWLRWRAINHAFAGRFVRTFSAIVNPWVLWHWLCRYYYWCCFWGAVLLWWIRVRLGGMICQVRCLWWWVLRWDFILLF